jgi:hypothetical protein
MASDPLRESEHSRPVSPSARPTFWERLVPHWRKVVIGAVALAALLWLTFERTAS